LNREPQDSVITRIHGGLGNQLFEYAAGHALARRLGVPHKVDTRVFGEAGERPLALREFNVPLAEAAPEELRRVAPQWGRWWKNKFILWRQRTTPFRRRRWIREETLDFDARLFSVRPPVYLDGWWQSEKYFADCAADIHALFGAVRAPSSRTATLGAELAAQRAVAVHVRRGDYVGNRDASLFHGVCPPAYYQAALAWIRERQPSARFAVFSDDPGWARENVARDGAARLIEADPAHSAHEDFYLLGCCAHFIIANSSFSWWPAWLSRSPGRLVVAPRRWFLGHDVKPADRFPADWHLIDA
jgi:hypothetical protein